MIIICSNGKHANCECNTDGGNTVNSKQKRTDLNYKDWKMLSTFQVKKKKLQLQIKLMTIYLEL